MKKESEERVEDIRGEPPVDFRRRSIAFENVKRRFILSVVSSCYFSTEAFRFSDDFVKCKNVLLSAEEKDSSYFGEQRDERQNGEEKN